ncbi:type II toxin-antitoxin system VapB family antitoxin [Blastococcus sp. SYSU D01050]
MRAGGSASPDRSVAPSSGLALARTECQTSIRPRDHPVARLARVRPLRGARSPGAGRPPGGDGAPARRIGWRGVAAGARAVRTEVGSLIFKAVREGRPYPEHGMSTKDWAMIPPRQIRLDTLVTTKRELALDALLADDSTFYGDLFPHAVLWHGEMYLEDGLHRALRAALQQRTVIHVRVLDLDALMPAEPAR